MNKTLARSLPTLFVLFTFSTTQAFAKVVGCLLDGGGAPEERFCGGDIAAKQIADSYKKTKTNAEFQILSGPGGKVRDPECTANFAHCVNNDPSCTELEISNKLQWNRKTQEWNSQPQSVGSHNSFGKLDPPYSASEDSFNKNCLFDSARPPKDPNKIDVCQVWTINHGAPKGVVFYNPGKKDDDHFLDSDKLSGKAEGCKTFRFVTNSCYGGQLSKLIFDKAGHVIPGRCGISASPPNYTALGFGVPDSKAPMYFDNQDSPEKLKGVDKTKRAAKNSPGKTLDTYYPMLHSGEAFEKSPSLDGLSRLGAGDEIKTGSRDSILEAGFQTYRTSDFFLETTLKNNRTVKQVPSAPNLFDPEDERIKLIRDAVAPHQATMDKALECFNESKFGEGIKILHNDVAPIISDQNGGLSADEKTLLKEDLRNEAITLRLEQGSMCTKINILSVQCAEEKSSECVSKALKQMTNRSCDAEESLRRYYSERQDRLLSYHDEERRATALRDKMEGLCEKFGVSVSECPDLKQITRKLRDTLSRNSSGCNEIGNLTLSDSPTTRYPNICLGTPLGDLLKDANDIKSLNPRCVEADRVLAKKGGDLDKFIKDNAHIRRYEDAKFRFAQVLELYKKGSPEKIHEYLTLRSCERGDFNKAAPAIEASP